MPQKIISFGLVIALGLWLGSNVVNINAAEDADLECTKKVAEEGSAFYQDYADFLDQYFKIDAPSSDQVETAMTRYRYYEEAVQSSYESAAKIKGASTISLNQNEFTRCIALRDEKIALGRGLLQAYAMQSAGSKRTFKFVDGLKAINDNMEILAENFYMTFPRMFEKMNSALPCYAKECVSE